VTLSVAVSDPEDGLEGLAVEFLSDLDGSLGTAASDGTGAASLDTDALSNGSHSLTAQVTDSRGDTEESARQFLVNGVPTAVAIHLEPAGPTTADDLQVVFDTQSVDPDGGDIYYRYAWSLDGVGTGTHDDGVVSADDTFRGQEWTVEVTPFELAADGPSATATVVIANSLPEVDGVAVFPATPLTDDDLICEAADMFDLDGDQVVAAYAWTSGGLTLATDAILPSTLTQKNTTYVCTVTPHDGVEDGVPVVSEDLTVQNTLPPRQPFPCPRRSLSPRETT